MGSILKFLSHGLVAGLVATWIGLLIEYNVFQSANGSSPIIYEEEKPLPSRVDSTQASLNYFKVSESESFFVQQDGILKITKKHKPVFEKEYDEVYSKLHINSIFGFEIFYSPIIFKKQLKIITTTSNGKFFDIFELDSAFSEAAFSSFVDNVLNKHNRSISISKKERNTSTHLTIIVLAVMLFLIFRINRAINNFTDSIFKGIESIFK